MPARAETATLAPPTLVPDGLVVPLPDVSLAMERGERVAYSVCSRVTEWQKPDIAGMAQVFTDRRFGDGERPFPINYAQYLQRAYYISTPTANSINKEINAFSAQWAVGDRGERFCDFQALRSDWLAQVLYLDGYHMQEMRFLSGNLVVLVDDAPGVFENVVFWYPRDLESQPVDQYSVRVVDRAGVEIYRLAARAGTVQTLQSDARGLIAAMTLNGDASFRSWAVTFPEGQPPLRIFGAFGPPFHLQPAGTLKLVDGVGTVIATVSWPAVEAGWQTLATVDVPPGTYEVQIDAPCPGGSCSYVFIAEDVPLP